MLDGRCYREAALSSIKRAIPTGMCAKYYFTTKFRPFLGFRRKAKTVLTAPRGEGGCGRSGVHGLLASA